MNRKDRRAQEKAQEKARSKFSVKTIDATTLAVSTPATDKAADFKKQGMTLKTENREAESIVPLTEALSLDSSLADVHFTLALMSRTRPDLKINMGKINQVIKDKPKLKESYQATLTILRTRKQYKEALVCQEELCRLFPDDLGEFANLALLFNLDGNKARGIKTLANVLNREPANKTYKAAFANICGPVMFDSFDPLVKKAIEISFSNIYDSNFLKFYWPWLAVVLLDPACKGFQEACLNREDEKFFPWLNIAKPEDILFVQEKFFIDGLRLLIVNDPILEKTLTNLRKWICLNIETLMAENRIAFFEPIIFGLGEQNFFNEYIYSCTKEESDVIAGITKQIKDGTLQGLSQTQAYGLVGCYRPLYRAFPDEKETIQALSKKSVSFANLAKTQFFDPLEELEIKKTLKNFGQFENVVSRDVQAQYEENPYPRWISLINHPTTIDSLPLTENEVRTQSQKILIAGCGTGRQALAAAAAYPNGKVTAIDLSRSSLAYGQRKAYESGLANKVDFLHADILSMEKWEGGLFDIVECSGVLHHMEDPFRGWQVLTNLLKPGGFFKIGLYSEIARQQVIVARKYVSDHKFPPTQEGIMACRDSIFALPEDNPMRNWLMGSGDFYATSLVRDLIFHVQEHRMTLPQIEEMMKKLNLVSTGFILSSAKYVMQYDKMFPADLKRANMANWHIFEQQNPDTFLGMYQFWCQKMR